MSKDELLVKVLDETLVALSLVVQTAHFGDRERKAVGEAWSSLAELRSVTTEAPSPDPDKETP